jgi:hypothetical protein
MKWNLGLNFYSTEVFLFNPLDANQAEFKRYIKEHKYHIYIVCKRKKSFFEKTVFENGFFQTTFYNLDEKHNKIYFDYKNSDFFKINSYKNGYYNIDNKVENDQEMRDIYLISLFCYQEDMKNKYSESKPLPSDLEVMYIGQAYGRTKLKTIDYRVLNHNKIQKIALDILEKGSNEEIIIVGLKFKNNALGTSFAGINDKVIRPTNESMQELQNKAGKKLTKGQEITVCEASLISYFKPKLNIEYKKSFPSRDFSSYNELYEIDFEYSYLVVNTESFYVRLFSEYVKERKYKHSKHFPLKSKSV